MSSRVRAVARAIAGLALVVFVAGHLPPFSKSEAQADASGGILLIAERTVAVGEILDTGVRDGDKCVMNHGSLEVEVEVSVDEPSAEISFRLTDDCKLVVASKQRHASDAASHTHRSIISADDSIQRYDAEEAKSEWSDAFAIDAAATFVRFTYDETNSGFSFYGSPEEECVKFGWWKTERCRMDSQSQSSSSIEATAYGRFSIKAT